MRASGAILIGLVGSTLVAVVNTVQAESDSPIGSVRASSLSAQAEQADDLERAAAMIVKLTNQYRRHKGRAVVTANAELTATAQDLADFMAVTDKYGHEADGSRPSERARKHKYDFCSVTENIATEPAFAVDTPAQLAALFTQGWERSPGHRRNMLDPNVLEIGVALAVSETSGRCYAVQMFGRPKSATIKYEIANDTDVVVTYRFGKQSDTLPAQATAFVPQCIPTDVVFTWPKSEGESATFHPADGDRFIISKRDGMFQVRKTARARATPAASERRKRPAGP
jgi:uncharacterized protein YkwD